MLHFIIYLLLSTGFGQTILLDEKRVVDAVRTMPPSSILELQGQWLSAQSNYLQFNEQFSPALDINAKQSKTNERQFAQFVPVTSESQAADASVSVQTLYGQTLKATVGTYQFSNNFIQDATTLGVGAKLIVDLNKNFLGATNKSMAEEWSLLARHHQTLSDIGIHSYVSQMRKIYWALVANNEAIGITKTLLESAIKLEREAKARFRNSVADSGEVARYEALVAAREGKLASLQYQREKLFQELRQAVPALSNGGTVLALGEYNIDSTIARVLHCTAYLAGQPLTPMENTHYDEAASLLLESYQYRQKHRQRHDDWDVTLIAEANKLGKDLSYSRTRDNFSDSSQVSWSAGVGINIPLGSSKSASQEVLTKLDEKRHLAQYQGLQVKLTSYHEQILRSVTLLQKLIALQKKNSKALQHSLEVTKRKYTQARISLNEMIQEQDSYFQNELETINTQYTIITTVLDYLAVFNQTPCQLNDLTHGVTL